MTCILVPLFFCTLCLIYLHVTYNKIIMPKIKIIKNTIWSNGVKITHGGNMYFK